MNNSPVTRFVFLSKTGNFFYAPLKNGALFLSLVKVRLVPVARLSDKRMQLQQKCLAGGDKYGIVSKIIYIDTIKYKE